MAAAGGCGGSSAKPASSGPDELPNKRRTMVPEVEEEEAEDGVEIEGLSGRMEVADIQKGMSPHESALSACYTGQIGKRRYLGGSVEFFFVVHKDGSLKSVQIAGSDLGAWPIEKCMLDIVRGIKFPKPQGNGEADFRVPLNFDARAPGEIWNEGRMEVEVSKVVPELAACAQATGTPEPNDVLVTLYIGTRGAITSVGFASPAQPIDDTWAQCAADKAMAWTLTDPRGKVVKGSFRYNAQ